MANCQAGNVPVPGSKSAGQVAVPQYRQLVPAVPLAEPVAAPSSSVEAERPVPGHSD